MTRAAGAEKENAGVDILRQALKTVSIDRIRSHIKTLEGTRHPLTAPAALEEAADYIRISMQSLGYEVAEHRFNEDGHDFPAVLLAELAAQPALGRQAQILGLLLRTDSNVDYDALHDALILRVPTCFLPH